MVDDVGHTSTKGKQFVTLVSKNGNYFYLIIDRDDKGNSTVHFLNQVDEMDLMALMNQENAEKLKAEIAQKEEANKPKEEVKPDSDANYNEDDYDEDEDEDYGIFEI